ncbi:cupredoxin domain-containing protein [Actinospongicola halichondriae]|uniref:cupredoxin domain-containing protein n=1 Tax=Actinospongicola halichondriae TaxID=3236844 RepID=UPI003D3CA414
MTPTRTIAALLASGVLLLGACGDDDTTAEPSTETTGAAETDNGSETAASETVDVIEIAEFEFAPVDATVAAGSEVTFRNADGTPHTATASDGSFNTDSVASDSEGTITAPDEPGSYAYICSFHPFMKGSLIVE